MENKLDIAIELYLATLMALFGVFEAVYVWFVDSPTPLAYSIIFCGMAMIGGLHIAKAIRKILRKK